MKEALKLALEALEADELDMVDDGKGNMVFRKEQAITAIKEALAQPEHEGNICARCGGIVFDPVLAQPEQEPVAWDVHTEHCFQGEYKHCCKYGDGDDCTAQPTKEALAQPEQEPWMYRIWNDKDAQWRLTDDCSWPAEPIYTTPPKRPWVNLTGEQIGEILKNPNIAEKNQGNWLVLPYAYAQAIEDKLKELNI